MSSGIRTAIRRAIVIEDDELLATSVEGLLSDEGWLTQSFASLEAAEQGFRDLMPDLLVLDLNLGERSGAELLASLACRADAPPTVVISAAKDLARVAARYSVVTVRKPFTLDQLMTAIDEAILGDQRPSLRAKDA